ncbi:hypothetical protein [Leptolyngbya sp. FACHB-261]|uniref:hypothetical protein n=1 Tax=Leptolyngbya sp. FACHB-261 TaxID=2692806 RepID=UPI0016835CC7|nr:hypothetical protein [Leptolyngbya sp. FACHB-261]
MEGFLVFERWRDPTSETSLTQENQESKVESWVAQFEKYYFDQRKRNGQPDKHGKLGLQVAMDCQ